jgi:hypothetical protein
MWKCLAGKFMRQQEEEASKSYLAQVERWICRMEPLTQKLESGVSGVEHIAAQKETVQTVEVPKNK